MTGERDDRLATIWRLLLVTVPAILMLGVLNALPQFLGGELPGVVRYASIEEAEARLGVSLYRPAAVPVAWRPVPSVVRYAPGTTDWVEYVFEPVSQDGPDSLVLCQSIGVGSAAIPAALLPAGELLQSGDVAAADHPVRVGRVLLADGGLVHEAWWRDGPRRVMLRARVPADTLLRLLPAVLGTR